MHSIIRYCKKAHSGFISSRPFTVSAIKSEKHVFNLKSRKILRISGADNIPYMQGLVTNDVTMLPEIKCMYAMFLNKNGRVLHDVILYYNREDILIESDQKNLNVLKKMLTVYKIRKKVSVAEETNVKILHTNESGLKQLPKEHIIQQTPDPRTSLLGFRLLYKTEENVSYTSIDTYTELRYKLGIAEGCDEIPHGKALPLEYNLDYMNGVSFHKGCYLGQELTARTRFTGVIRKRVVPVKLMTTNSVLSDETLYNENGKKSGKMCTKFTDMGYGLASLRLQFIDKPIKTKSGETINCIIPEWWKFKTGTEFADGICAKYSIIDLPDTFVKYLLDDGPLILPKGLENNIHVTLSEPYCEESGFSNENNDEDEIPDFPNVIEEINSVINKYSSVFPKLNWSSPRDAVWISPCFSLKCSTAGEIILLLKSSQFIMYDLTSPFKLCDDSSLGDPTFSYQLVLRKWAKLSPGMEFRCFIKNHHLIAISQRNIQQHYDHLIKEKEKILNEIITFVQNNVIGKFDLINYTVDVYKKLDGDYWIIDFNPWGEMTDPLHFSWNELNNNDGPSETDIGVPIISEGKRMGEFRVTSSTCTMQPSDMLKYRIPQDFLDLSTGTDATKLVDLLRKRADDQDSSSEDEIWHVPICK